MAGAVHYCCRFTCPIGLTCKPEFAFCSVPVSFIRSLFQCHPRCGVITATSPPFLMNFLFVSHISWDTRTGSQTLCDNGKFIIRQLCWTMSITLGRPVSCTGDSEYQVRVVKILPRIPDFPNINI
jgi:hypothetical protein